jgi:hypothetical protein
VKLERISFSFVFVDSGWMIVFGLSVLWRVYRRYYASYEGGRTDIPFAAPYILVIASPNLPLLH